MAAPIDGAVPASKLVFEKSSLSHPKSTHRRVLNNKYFTHAATVILPCCERTPNLLSEIDQLAEQQPSHLLHNVPLHRLLDKEFIEAFVKRGHLYILSHKRHIDTQNCVALVPTGHLILHLTKDTYEQLGLEGKPSMFSGRKPSKFVVTLDLKPESFAPGRKGYDRVLWCLKDRLDLNFDLLLSWTPHDEKISPSSVSKYFESKGLVVSPVPWCVSTRWLNGISTPVLDSTIVMETQEACGRDDLWEWLGAAACGIDLSESGADNYLSTLACPSPCVKGGRCCVVQITGFLTPTLTSWLLDRLSCEVEQRDANKPAPWGSLTLHGFHDSPVSSALREHGFFQEGDNLHCLVAFSNKDYWLYSAYGHYDLCQ